ncbi:fibronectin type III domain-containing protein [Legionella sp.]|uniref:fibronectin type III domain-containing protein n=1 Tax=Legionella sp. TaxID=459 RepID=UPI003CAE01AB
MIKRMVIKTGVALLLMFCQTVFAESGLLFNVTATGVPANVDITLCLNGKGPISCQNYTVSALNLSILAVPNHFYSSAGIKINTPGYAITNLGVACTPIPNGYCLFPVRPTVAKSIVLQSTSVPAAPTNVVATVGNAQVTVTWSPVINGSAPITGYIVTSSPGGLTCATTGALTCTVTGLTNGVSYTFMVTATNATGTDPASAPSNAVTPFASFVAGGANGIVYFSSTNGTTWAPTAGLDGSSVNAVFASPTALYAGTANGNVYYSNNEGILWQATLPPDLTSVQSIYVTSTTLYAGTAAGNVYSLSLANPGGNWTLIGSPDSSSVNSLYVVSANDLYAGTANGFVYYSSNAAISWTEINGKPDGSAIRSVYLANGLLYVGTANELVYSSASLMGGGSWGTAIAQQVYSLFVPASASMMYVGTQGGFVFALPNENELAFITYTLINSLYLAS